ncbi:MAG: hypothetical protein JEZ09_11525 [Salinivirgaceae bacterium]|nr:hypothetical protein [Salinivirgaceae bacterium]
MKANSRMEKITSYLKELTIVTIGVLIALFISNHKENNQAIEYHRAAIKTINSEVGTNYSSLNGVIESHTDLLDTITKYSDDNIAIMDLFQKVNGVQFNTLSNTGLEFYKRSKINLIDLEIMSTLYHMKFLSDLIETKLERFSDFVYPNIKADSKESKTIVSLYLRDVLNSENQLLQVYERMINENVETENNKK